MRVLQLTEAFAGGVVTSLTHLSNGLAARGHEIHLAFARRPETPTDVAACVHPTVRLHELKLVRSINLGADMRGLFAIWRLVREIMPDIVHLHSSKAGLLGRAVTRLAGYERRTFYSPRGLAFLQEDFSARTRVIFEKIEWGAAACFGGTIVACSASERDLIRERIRPRRLALVENAIDVEAVQPRVQGRNACLRVGIVGRITYARNAALFADMARRFSSSTVQFLWVGGGEAEDRAKLEAAGVLVSGWMPRADALAQMSTLDVYLHPSRWEGMPIALIEAQVCGLPAIATDVIGNRDVIRHGETGFISRDAGEMQSQLAQLLEDASLRDRMGARARDIAVQRFNISRLIDEMEALYVGALAASKMPSAESDASNMTTG